MGGNTNFDQIVTTTLDNYRSTIEDNIFEDMPLLYWLKKKGRKKVLDGGNRIVVPLMYGKNSTVKSYSEYEELDTTPQEGITSAEFPWRQVSGSITISGAEERKNSGKQAIINLLEAKIKQTEMSIQDALAAMIYADGTGNSGKDFLGLAAISADTPTSGTLGGIDRASNTWWRNQAVVGTKSSTKFDNLIEKMRSLYNSCSKGIDHPDFIVCDQTSFEGYESQLAQYERFTDKKAADGGFESLKFKGATMTFDPVCPATSTLGKMYFLNSKYLSWTVHNKANFHTTQFLRPENQDAKTAQILLMGNLVISNCSRVGVIYDIDLT